MTARIRCNKCEAESYYDGTTKIYCPTCFAQLEAELAGMELMEAEAAQFAEGMELVPEGTQVENERLRDLFRAGHELDEGRTWFWDDDIVKALGGEG